jgi:uncharacterized protein
MELSLFIEHQCNLRCSYCYTGEKFNRRMTRETLQLAVALALATPGAHLDVSFFGGEPLIHLDFVRECVAYVEAEVARLPAPRPTLRFLMNTNATLIDEAAITLFTSRRFTVFVSLDGPREVHDQHRVDAGGRGSFDKTLAGIRRLRAAGIPFQIMVVFGASSAERLGDALHEALPLGAEKILFSANYRDDWNEAGFAGLRRGLDAAAEVWAEQVRVGQVVPLEPIHTKILSHLKSGIPRASRCSIAGRELTVAPSGRIYPCPQMVGEDNDMELVIGHVETGIDRKRVAELQGQKEASLETCASCELFTRCQNQCGCRHIALSGRLGHISATLCETEAAYVDCADRIAERLFAEGCEGFIDYYYRRKWEPAAGATLVPLRRNRDGLPAESVESSSGLP